MKRCLHLLWRKPSSDHLLRLRVLLLDHVHAVADELGLQNPTARSIQLVLRLLDSPVA